MLLWWLGSTSRWRGGGRLHRARRAFAAETGVVTLIYLDHAAEQTMRAGR
jgi:hypothetical protein